MTENNVNDFLEWKQGLKAVVIGKKTMYNVKGYHKYLDESELWGYWSVRVKKIDIEFPLITHDIQHDVSVLANKKSTEVFREIGSIPSSAIQAVGLSKAYKDFYDKYGY